MNKKKSMSGEELGYEDVEEEYVSTASLKNKKLKTAKKAEVITESDILTKIIQDQLIY